MSEATPPAAAESRDERKRKDWELLRAAIVHEDNLVNHRLTWLFTVHGFLIGGFFLVQSAVVAGKLADGFGVVGLEALLTIVFLAGIWICLISGALIAAAYKHIAQIRAVWHGKYPEEKTPLRPLPGWIFGQDSAGTLPEDAAVATPAAAEGAPAAQPDFPPIIGEFRYSYFQNTHRIPLLLMVIDGVIVVACVTIAIRRLVAG
jgi:hypothetical protein